jgi:hypothetical protein
MSLTVLEVAGPHCESSVPRSAPLTWRSTNRSDRHWQAAELASRLKSDGVAAISHSSGEPSVSQSDWIEFASGGWSLDSHLYLVNNIGRIHILCHSLIWQIGRTVPISSNCQLHVVVRVHSY